MGSPLGVDHAADAAPAMPGASRWQAQALRAAVVGSMRFAEGPERAAIAAIWDGGDRRERTVEYADAQLDLAGRLMGEGGSAPALAPVRGRARPSRPCPPLAGGAPLTTFVTSVSPWLLRQVDRADPWLAALTRAVARAAAQDPAWPTRTDALPRLDRSLAGRGATLGTRRALRRASGEWLPATVGEVR